MKVGTTYLGILQLEGKKEVEEANLELYKEFKKIARIKYQVGATNPMDIYRFQSEIANSTAKIAEVDANIKSLEAELGRLMNLPMTNSYKLSSFENYYSEILTEELFKRVTFDTNISKKFIEYFIRYARVNNPKIKEMEINLLAKEQEKAMIRKERLPKVALIGEYSRDLMNHSGKGSNYDKKDDQWAVGVGFNLPIYTGGELSNKKIKANYELENLKYRKDILEGEIYKGITKQYATALKDYIAMTTARESLEATKKNLYLVSDLYREGAVSITELLDAQNRANSTRILEFTSKYSFLSSVLLLERLQGEFLITLPPYKRERKLREMRSLVY